MKSLFKSKWAMPIAAASVAIVALGVTLQTFSSDFSEGAATMKSPTAPPPPTSVAPPPTPTPISPPPNSAQPAPPSGPDLESACRKMGWQPSTPCCNMMPPMLPFGPYWGGGGGGGGSPPVDASGNPLPGYPPTMGPPMGPPMGGPPYSYPPTPYIPPYWGGGITGPPMMPPPPTNR